MQLIILAQLWLLLLLSKGCKPAIIIQQTMFLNLKNNKRVIEVINNQYNKPAQHPKTHREEHNERQSKQHKQLKSHRQHPNFNSKKPAGSTALSTIQPTNSSFSINNNPYYVITKQESLEKESIGKQTKSNEKIDSHRLDRVASAYRKIKKYDNNDGSLLIQQNQKSQQKLKKTGNKGRVLVKKQLLSNIVNSYICATEPNQEIQHKTNNEKYDSRMEYFQQILDPFFQLFADQNVPRSSRLKSKSHSNKDMDLNKSIQKNSNSKILKEKKKQSNQILIRQSQSHLGKQDVDIHEFINKFSNKLKKAKERIEDLTITKKYKYVQPPVVGLIQQFFDDIESFVLNLYQICIRQTDCCLSKFQKQIFCVTRQQQQMKEQFSFLEESLMVQRQKSKMLQKMVLSYQQKSLYSTIILNQLEFHYDVDSHIRQKLYNQAKRNGLISQFSQSQMEEGKIEQVYTEGCSKKMQANQNNLYDNNQNQFVSYKIECFSKCTEDQRGKRR